MARLVEPLEARSPTCSLFTRRQHRVARPAHLPLYIAAAYCTTRARRSAEPSRPRLVDRSLISSMATSVVKGKRASNWLSSAKAGFKSLGNSSTTASHLDSSQPDPSSSSSAGGGRGVGAEGPMGQARSPKGKEKCVEQDGPGTGEDRGRPAAAKALDMPVIPPRNIIGAVEDEWPLYRCVRLAQSLLSELLRLIRALFARSCRPSDYEIGPAVGFGAAAVVHLASFCPAGVTPRPKPLTCAVKIIDVDRMATDADIQRLRMCVAFPLSLSLAGQS